MYEFLERLGIREHNPGGCCGINEWMGEGDTIASVNPASGKTIATVGLVSEGEYDTIVSAAQAAFHTWRMMPGPVRGTIVRDIGLRLEERKEDLARLVALEMGKILEEARGEVQEAIDMAAFASGLSRQLYGKTMTSERPEHRLYEQWHPLGPVGIITAFNFPVAVWSWNALVATTCGDSTVWKPSSKVPLCAIAVQRIVNEVLAEHGWERGVACLACGTGRTAGTWIAQDERIPLVSATGSVAMGRRVSETVAGRLGRTILELGGNNAVIVSKSADLDQAVPAIVFGAIGTAGQRCTSIRRLIVHESVRETLVARLVKAYSSLTIGDPLDPKTRMGPLIDTDAVSKMQMALESARDQGGTVLYGGKRRSETFVDPAIVEVPGNVPVVAEETFAPILYVMAYEDFDEALWLHNDVPQGLSSSLFSTDLREVETFLSHKGSDCGIANVNVSTSGAEIGAAFGGEKETGGGREAGSDAWKAYMRRQSVTTNWGTGMPLSQGIDFSY